MSNRWEPPWPEKFAAAAESSGRAGLFMEFATAVRRTGSLMQLMGQAAADRIGVNATDLNCLNILSFRGQMTAGELAKETGLTTASITGIVDRLENAGFVRRERGTTDRRRVTIHLNTGRAIAEVTPVFAPMMADFREIAASYTDDELRLIVNFYSRMEEAFREHLIRLRTKPPSPAS
jgi:DNA-binding MarR family transcriptional regulator